ncbi:hypothetical protein HDZ31DRAFT_66259 [Schizophyllum fasciatum]
MAPPRAPHSLPMAPASSIVFAPGIVGNAHAITLRLSKSEDERSRRRLYSPRGEVPSTTNRPHAPSSSSLPETRPPSPREDTMPLCVSSEYQSPPHSDHVPRSSTSAPASRPPSPSGLTIRIRKEDHVAYIEKRAHSDDAVSDVTTLMRDACSLTDPADLDALARAMQRQLRVAGPTAEPATPSRMRQLELEVETNIFLAEVGAELRAQDGRGTAKRKFSTLSADEDADVDADEEMEGVEGPPKRKVARLPSTGSAGYMWRARK